MYMYMKFFKKLRVYLMGFTVLTGVALAGEGNTEVPPSTTSTTELRRSFQLPNILEFDTVPELFGAIGKFLIGLSIPLLTLFILWGAFQLMTSGGSPERVEKGRKTIYWAILGFVVLVLAGGIGTLVANFLGGTGISTDGGIGDAPVTNLTGLMAVINKASQWMFGILMALSVVMILYSAFLYMFSGGSDDKIKKAKDTLTYAIIAVAIAVLAGGVGVLIRNFFNSSNDSETVVTCGSRGGICVASAICDADGTVISGATCPTQNKVCCDLSGN